MERREGEKERKREGEQERRREGEGKKERRREGEGEEEGGRGKEGEGKGGGREGEEEGERERRRNREQRLVADWNRPWIVDRGEDMRSPPFHPQLRRPIQAGSQLELGEWKSCGCGIRVVQVSDAQTHRQIVRHAD